MIKSKVLFLRSGNSCRTQMAEAFLRDLAADRFELVSTGGDPTPLDPEAVDAMRERALRFQGRDRRM
jgi:arsenate reductase (thioredoxin)